MIIVSAKEESIARKEHRTRTHKECYLNCMATGLSPKGSMTERGEDINNPFQAGRRASEGALSQKLRYQDLRAVMN